MEETLIYLQGFDLHISKEELAEMIIKEGKKQVGSHFKKFKSEIDFELMRPDRSNEDNLTLISSEIDKLKLTSEILKSYKSPTAQKEKIIKSISMVLDLRGDQIFYKNQYEIHLSIAIDSVLIPRKQKYLYDLLDTIIKKPEPDEKIMWLGTPSEFGFLINQLEKEGYIKKSEHKTRSQDSSWKRTAALLYNAFYVPNLQRDGETSEENLYKEILNPSLTAMDVGFIKISRRNKKK